jgi:hypothetical protein
MHRLRTAAATLACLGSVVAPVLVSAPAQASSSVRITQIHYGQTGNNLNTEYIIFKNTTSSTINLKGWRIVSAPASDHQYYVFPGTKLGGGKYLILFTGTGTNRPGKRYWNATSPRWNNDGDLAILRNAGGGTVDSCQYAGGGTRAYC